MPKDNFNSYLAWYAHVPLINKQLLANYKYSLIRLYYGLYQIDLSFIVTLKLHLISLHNQNNLSRA